MVMKYLLVGDNHLYDMYNSLYPGTIELSGLFQWVSVFKKYGEKGDILPYWRLEDVEEYDVVHINYTPSNLQLPTILHDSIKNTSIKLVINVDLDVARWSPNWAKSIIFMEKELQLADQLFHVEPVGASFVEKLTGKNVVCNPHPVDVSELYRYIKDFDEREQIISTMFHRYTGDTLSPYFAQIDIPLRKVLFGFDKQKHGLVSTQGMYDQLLPPMPFVDYIKEVSKSMLGCDLYDGYSFGRAPIEFAALGIPSVVSNRIGSSWLFPYTAIDPFDFKYANELFSSMLTDDNFVDAVITTAHEKCKFYSLENSFKRFNEMMEAIDK